MSLRSGFYLLTCCRHLFPEKAGRSGSETYVL
nr:MAG TPA: hypothetical protein [Bacteriophage sp.]